MKLSPILLFRTAIPVLVLLVISSIPTTGVVPLKLEPVATWSRPKHNWNEIEYKNGFLYAGTDSNGWYVIDVRNPSQPRTLQTNSSPNRIWGLTWWLGELFVATQQGVGIYNIQNPGAPSHSHAFLSADAWPVTSHRGALLMPAPDVFGIRNVSRTLSTLPPNQFYRFGHSVIQLASDGDYLYAVSPNSGLLIAEHDSVFNRFDIVGSANSPGAASIRLAGRYAYLAGNGFSIFDISNPASPRKEGEIPNIPVRQFETFGNLAYLAREETGVSVVDIAAADAPQIATTYNTPGSAKDVAVYDDYIFVADGTNGIVILKQVLFPDRPVEFFELPGSTTLMKGEPLTLSVGTTGTSPITYEWFKNDLPIPGATNSTYSVASTTMTDQGIYSVQATNPRSSILSPALLVRIITPATLTWMQDSTALTINILSDDTVLSDINKPYLQVETSTDLLHWEQSESTISELPGTAHFTVPKDPLTPARYFRLRETE